MNKLILGSQVSLKSPKYLKGTVEQIVDFGGNAMMFFVGSPHSFKQTKKELLDKNIFLELLNKNKINIKNIYVHASYLINFGNYKNERIISTSNEILTAVCENALHIGINNIIIHPGSALNGDRKKALFSLVKGLDEILFKYKTIKIHLETMSGRGGEIGINFNEMSFIIKESKNSQRIFVCFDTCHLFAYGYDIKDNFDVVLKEFENKIGLDKLMVLHLNDSLKPLGSRKDRHANIGEGFIGLEALKKIVHHPKLLHVAKLLETPYKNGKPIYKEEIKILK